jgi:cytochrome c biogenesis protein CcmG/thiol:disulfide interchange protein DsbE
MARVSPLMLAPPLIFAALAVMFYVGMQRENPDALPSTRIGQPAPALALSAFGSGPVPTDADLRTGEVVLVNYWASWCAPCRVEHPHLTALAEEGVRIVGVNFKDDPAKAAAFLAELGDPYALIGADADGRTALEWGVYGVPETYVIDGAGRVVLRFAGPVTSDVLEKTLRPAIAEAETGAGG